MPALARKNRQLMTQIAQTGRVMRTRFDAELRKVELTQARGRLLLHLLSASRPVAQGELAELLEVEHPTVVRLLDGLEHQSLIERRPVPGDRRAKEIVLTAEGRVLGERVAAMTDLIAASMLEGFTEEELATTMRVLERLSDRFALAGTDEASNVFRLGIAR